MMLVTLGSGLLLIAALALGWNTPRPDRPPDRRGLKHPFDLFIPAGKERLFLLGSFERDGIVEAEFVHLAGPTSGFDAYGLVYRARDEDNYWVFAIGSDGYCSILAVTSGTKRELFPWQQFPHIRRGDGTNQLRVSCVGEACRFYINDEYLTTLTSAGAAGKKFGVWGHSPMDETVVQVSRLAFWASRDE